MGQPDLFIFGNTKFAVISILPILCLCEKPKWWVRDMSSMSISNLLRTHCSIYASLLKLMSYSGFSGGNI